MLCCLCMRWRGLFVASIAAGMGACSLFVDTRGLSGAIAPVATEGGGPSDAKPETSAADAGADGEAPVFDCDGGFETTSFDSFDMPAGVTVDNKELSAVVTTLTMGQKVSAAGVTTVHLTPSRIHLAYDLVMRPHLTIYRESGCGIDLDVNGGTRFRQTFWANRSAFGQYVNINGLGGNDESRETQFLDLPDGESSQHVDIVLTASGATGVVDVTVGTQNKKESFVLSAVPQQVAVRCGIQFGEQVTGVGGSTTTTVKNLVLSVCP